MPIQQTDQRLFRAADIIELTAFVPPPFTGWTYAELISDNSAYRWNSTTLTWEPLVSSVISGTLNSVAKFTSATTIGNSSISDTGTEILLNVPTQAAVATGVGTNNTVAKSLTAVHTAPGGGLPGMGVEIGWGASNSLGLTAEIADIDAVFTTTTAGAETGRLEMYVQVAGLKTEIEAIDQFGTTIVPTAGRILVPTATDLTASPVTINRMKGTVQIVAGTSSITVNNSLCLTTSAVLWNKKQNDAGASQFSVTTANGSFTITSANVAGATTAVTATVVITWVLFQ